MLLNTIIDAGVSTHIYGESCHFPRPLVAVLEHVTATPNSFNVSTTPFCFRTVC